MGRMSRQKGKRGEREVAAELTRLFGVACRRSVQFCGRAGDSDVVGLPGVHTEVKFVEKLNVGAALDQAIADAKNSDVPVVVHRASRRPWIVTMRLDDLPRLAAAIEKLKGDA